MSASSFEDLLRHVGHEIVCVRYAKDGAKRKDIPDEDVVCVSVECETCFEVLMSFDRGEE